MKKLVPLLLLFLLFISFVIISANTFSFAVSNDLQKSFFRLHIIANSDSEEDQNLKLKIRDKIIEYIDNQNFESKEDTINFVNNNKNSLYEIAQKTVYENGYSYPISINIGNFYFPTKYYGNISLPAGFYDGIKIEIGDANGQNWWCSLFPPLCFMDVSSGIIENDDLKKLDSSLNNEEILLLTESNNSKTIQFKFKILELFNRNQN